MVNFSDLNKDKNERGKSPLSKTDGTDSPKSRLSFSRLEKERDVNGTDRLAKTENQNLESRNALYDQASLYLRQVFDSVRNRRRFPLEPGIAIIEQVIEVQTPKDPLFIRAIHSDDPFGFLIHNCVNVAIFAVKLAQNLGFDQRSLIEIGLAGLLHEVGMGIIPEELIYKKEKLSRQEFNIFRKRTEFSYKILSVYGEEYAYLAETAIQLQERIDGSGYPLGLRGNEISNYAQIIGLVDMYEALIHSRPQRERFLHFSAVKEVIKTGKKCFRKKYIKALLEIFSIFPLDSYVKLNSNAIGKVIETYPDASLRPKLQIVLDSQRREVMVERVVDLRENPILYIVDSVSEKDLITLTGGDNGNLPRRAPEGKEESVPQETDIDSTVRAAESGELKGLPDLDSIESRSAAIGDGLTGADVSTDGVSRKSRPHFRRRFGRLKYVLIISGMVLLIVAILWQLGFVSPVPENDADPAVNGQPRGRQAGKMVETSPVGGKNNSGDDLPKKKTDATTRTADDETVGLTAAQGRSNGAGRGRDTRSVMPSQDFSEGPGAETLPTPSQPVVEIKRPVQGSISAGAPQNNRVHNAAPAPAYPYSIKLAYFKTREQAQKSLSGFIRMGLSPYWVKVDLGKKGTWYRVFAGHFSGLGQAEKVIAEKHLTAATVKKTLYATFVGSYTPGEGLENELQRLSDQGFSPYTIMDGDGLSHIYVGAFYTRKGAEEQRAELTACGVDCRVVER